MAKRKKESAKMLFYEIPQDDCVIACQGEEWDRVYGAEEEEKKLHFHNLMEIGICRRGEGLLWLDGEKREYVTDTITIIPANFPHTLRSGGVKNSWEYIYFDPTEFVEELCPGNVIGQNEIRQKLSQRAWAFSRAESPVLGQMVDVILRESGNRQPYYRQMIKNYLRNLVLEMMRHNPELAGNRQIVGSGMRIVEALDFINRHYADSIRVKDLADVCGLSESHFRRVFEENMNMSPMEYINFVRIQRACELMKKSDDSIERVAAKCGFPTQSTFNRNFRKFLDTSPYQWKTRPANYERKLMNYNMVSRRGW